MSLNYNHVTFSWAPLRFYTTFVSNILLVFSGPSHGLWIPPWSTGSVLSHALLMSLCHIDVPRWVPWRCGGCITEPSHAIFRDGSRTFQKGGGGGVLLQNFGRNLHALEARNRRLFFFLISFI